MNNRLREGSRVEIVADRYGQVDKCISLIGLTGTIRKYGPIGSDRNHMAWDVVLDSPLRDGRKFLWCSTRELKPSGNLP